MYSSRLRFQRANRSAEDDVRPVISVCIPTYNGADYICDAVGSVLCQQYADYEILIVDNCSTDQTAKRIEDLQSELGSRIRYFRNEQNIGLAGNFNACLNYARGEYIKFLCVDDLLLPDCLALMAAELDRHPSATLVCGGRLIIDSNNRPIQLKRYSKTRALVPGEQVIERCVLSTNLVGEPTAVMFRKQDVTTSFREDLPQLLDMEMWFRLLEKGDLLNIELPVCAVRIHEAQVSGVNFRLGHLVADRIRIYEDYGRHGVLRLSWSQRVKHRVAMTFRVWVSRAYLSTTQKRMVLDKYGIMILYPFMALIALILRLKQALARRVFLYTSSVNFTERVAANRSFLPHSVNK